jgi:hypothetical protein
MKTYNEKAFLLPDSTNSAAMFHAKVEEDLRYKLTIHDCNNGIRLHGTLNTPEEVEEAVEKLANLANGVLDLLNFIQENYLNTEKKDGRTEE